MFHSHNALSGICLSQRLTPFSLTDLAKRDGSVERNIESTHCGRQFSSDRFRECARVNALNVADVLIVTIDPRKESAQKIDNAIASAIESEKLVFLNSAITASSPRLPTPVNEIYTLTKSSD